MRAFHEGLRTEAAKCGDADTVRAAELWLDRFRKAVEYGDPESWIKEHAMDLRQVMAQAGFVIANRDDEPLEGDLLAAVARDVFAGVYFDPKPRAMQPGTAHSPGTRPATTPNQEQMNL